MEQSIASILCEYLDKARECKSRDELAKLRESVLARLEGRCGADERALCERIFDLTARLADRKAPELSDPEKAENMLVQKLLDQNLFTYHFQPIVRVDNGEIFAYEALMRAGDIKGMTPFHILKYAEITHRLYEVEQYTFLNVLRIVAASGERLAGRPVFINSMPNVHILPEKAKEIEELLGTVGNVVVEMTESSEYNDRELDEIKEKYERLGIPIAIDDFGTGYSNIANLLRYTPNFVKIDRSLLSGIESSPNKKHFVREIIDFCHENKIMALAEGVESFEELRTVILLGADLIQGYYTARPAPELIQAIPYEIRSEIRDCRHEREDGRRLRTYRAEKGERVSLERLSREGYSCIHIGVGYQDGTVTVAGSQHHESGIHIITAEGFSGTLALENARLSNLTGRPCIDIGEKSRLTLSLAGVNRLDNSGIRVPESSELMTAGLGELDIRLGSADYYGIGNDLSSTHGKLHFNQDGAIKFTAGSHAGVCIGSGLGGIIDIDRGRYVFDLNGSSNIAIGAFDGPTSIDIVGCDFECTAAGAYSVAIGSVSGEADIHIIYSSIRWASDSQLSAGIGTLHGRSSRVHIESASVTAEMSADALAVFGSLNGESQVTLERSSIRMSADGKLAMGFGSPEGNTSLTLTDIDITGKLSNTVDACTKADPGDIHISGGRYRVSVNGRMLETV